jgi:Alpha/beta hydrolase domain
MIHKTVFLVTVCTFLVPTLAPAEVTQLVIQSSELYDGGASYGSVGQYEDLKGYAIGELDPSNSLNAGIINLDKASRNSHGRVQYRVDVEILKPVDMEKGNGTLFYDVVNRGHKVILPYIDLADGYTIVWSGWQGDLPQSPGLLNAEFPVATDHGQPIVGQSREEYVDIGTGTFVGKLTYPAASLDKSQATLTVREKERDPRHRIDTWKYLNDGQIEITAPGAPYDAGAIYEFIYPAKDPIVMGIGFAATRDMNSFLRFELEDSVGHRNPLAGEDESSHEPQGRARSPLRAATVGERDSSTELRSRSDAPYHAEIHETLFIKHAIIEGVSQSGRFTRDFLWQGFNEDEKGREVFDGAFPIIAGSRKTFTNFQFAQPGRFSRQHEDHLQPGDQFPFTYATRKDPLTGRVDGILKKCISTHTCPKIFHLDGEFELWGARGSLVVTDGNPDGPRDITLPPNVRVYMVAGTPHDGGRGAIIPASPSKGICQNLQNPLGTLVVVPALIHALNDWITTGKEPPKSCYGSVRQHTLVPSNQKSTGFPNIPGVTYTGLFNSLRVTDYNVQPPAEGAQYCVLVPRSDRDGNSLAGIRLPPLQHERFVYSLRQDEGGTTRQRRPASIA